MALDRANVRFAPASDCSLLVSLGDAIGGPAHGHVLALVRAIETNPPPYVVNINPAYCSVLVTFDLGRTDHAAVERELRERIEQASHAPAEDSRTIEIPVCYGGEFGPDLEGVAQHHGLTAERVVELHTGAAYVAYFLGFAPGFAYLVGLAEEIATPRLATPRQRVPRGSVGIAGRQTGVYPMETPGGWRLIGRTPVRLFEPEREPMNRIEIGDRVRFVAIGPERFGELEGGG